jgi:SAM-dependent methyltransferase
MSSGRAAASASAHRKAGSLAAANPGCGTVESGAVAEDVSTPIQPPYLVPYVRAAQQHGSDFPSLLWASPHTQAARFDAIQRLADLQGKSVLDVGCGRADLLAFLLARGVRPADYIGIEAVDELAAAAERRCAAAGRPPARIIRADFVREPLRLFVGADVVVISGSLNTVEDGPFYTTIRRAFEAAAETLVVNFLCSSDLAGAEYLRWRCAGDVLAFARQLGGDVRTLDDYLHGDCTLAIKKPDRA